MDDLDCGHWDDADREVATGLLERIHDGDAAAAEQLLPMVYERLHAMAGGILRGQRAHHTLQPTALLHEAT